MSDRFDADWLALREPADHRARADHLLPVLNAWAAGRGHLNVLDLGCGTGSNLRYLAPRLSVPQDWLLLDHDPALLDRVQPPESSIQVRRQQQDLRAMEQLLPDRVDLVTGSALLDLVSEDWLAQLVTRCAARNSAALFALNYDGTVHWSPPDPVDDDVRAAFNRHHAGDKGFGPSLGWRAGERAAALFRSAGYQVVEGDSPWQLGIDNQKLQQAFSDGWYEAACEQEPALRESFTRWRSRRRGPAEALRVGHVDVLALPEAGWSASD